MIRSHQAFWNRMLMFGDICISAFALYVAWIFRFNLGLFTPSNHVAFPGVIVVYVVASVYISNTTNGLYRAMRKEKFASELISLVRGHLILGALLTSLLYVFKVTDFPRSVLLVYIIVSFMLVSAFRMFVRLTLRKLRAAGYNQKHILLVGINRYSLEAVRDTIMAYPWMGYQAEELLLQSGEDYAGATWLLQSQLENLLGSQIIDEVLLVTPGRDINLLKSLMEICEYHGVQVSIVPDYFPVIPKKPVVNDFGGIPAFVCQGVPLEDPVNSLVKRAFDMTFSTIVLVGLCPLLLAIAFAIKLTSPGPVIFKQIRVGKNRRPFTIYKFRTMHTPESVHGHNDDYSSRPYSVQVAASLEGWTIPNDPRRTKFGAFLRSTSLDEIPQFWNVLKGDMSVIGPRPEQPKYVNEFRVTIPKYMLKHHVKPGITGWAQVNGWRGDTSISERINCDVYYIENWSFGMDLKIVWLTLFKGIVNKNAY